MKTWIPVILVGGIMIALVLSAQKKDVYDFNIRTQLAGVSEPTEGVIIDARTQEEFDILSFLPYGSAAADYNNDTCIDIFVPNPNGFNILYANNCDGTFTNTASEAGVNYSGRSSGAAFGDIENDGCLDLYITNHSEQNILYKNNCDGTFTDITDAAGVGGDSSISTGVAWVDYDNDGYLDIFVTNMNVSEEEQGKRIGDYLTLTKDTVDFTVVSAKNMLYKNNTNETFTNVTESVGLGGNERTVSFAETYIDKKPIDSGISHSSVWFDSNNDSCMDVFITSDSGSPTLYTNNCDGTFSDTTETAGLQDFYYGRGVSVADIDNNGTYDIYVTNGETDRLYIQEKNGAFKNHAPALNIQAEERIIETRPNTFLSHYYRQVGWGVSMFDHDSDGDQDIYVANGANFLKDTRGSENILYTFNKGGFEKNNNIEVNNIYKSMGVVTLDYDSDGDLDLFITNADGPNTLLENNSTKNNNWISIQLQGTKSNSLGIGARVTVTSGKDAWTRQVVSGGSFLSQNDYGISVGVGKKQTIDSITVIWPSGITQTISDIPVNSVLSIEEE